MSESLDRISRDQEHTARVYKLVKFWGGRIVTLQEGEITPLHVGLVGTFSQMYLENLAFKTRRGLRGVVEEGRIASKPAFGYEKTGVVGVFRIVEDQAIVVRRIFEAYAAGQSPRAICRELNAEGIPGPAGRAWRANTIVGDRAAATGIINNPVYAGEIVWNRQTWRKDPTTGKRKAFPLPQSEWLRAPAPQLRIVDEHLWNRVRRRQGEFVERGPVRRSTRPLSGLLVCAVCGSRMTILGRDRYGCPTHKEEGAARCANGRTALAADIERRLFEGLRANLCEPERIVELARDFVEELARRRRSSARIERQRLRELAVLEREQNQLVTSLGRLPPAAMDTVIEQLGSGSRPSGPTK